jgi:hypothetical protein
MKIFGFNKKKNEKVEKTEEQVLKEKYGVMKDIPARKLETESIPFRHVLDSKGSSDANLPELILKIEKIDGKLDVMNQIKDNIDERVTQLAEEIGELRTMVLERDRSFDKIAVNFESIKDTLEDLEPNKLKKYFEKKEKEILENRAKIENVENLVKALNEESKKFRGTMEKIKSFENLIDVSYDIDRRISKIKESKDHVDMIVSKVESIFSEMNDKVSELESQREKIDKLDKLSIEMTQMLDEVSVKLNKFAEKKDLGELKKDIDEDLKKVQSYLSGKPPIKGGQPPIVKTVDDTKLSQLYAQMAKLKSVVDSQNLAIKHLSSRSGSHGPQTGNLELRAVKLSLRFFQIMNILNFERDAKKIRNYLSELRAITHEMKSLRIWNEEKQNYMEQILNKLSDRIEPFEDRKTG